MQPSQRCPHIRAAHQNPVMRPIAAIAVLGRVVLPRHQHPEAPSDRETARPPPPLPPPDRTWNGRRAVWTRITTTPDHTPIRPTLGHRRHGPLPLRMLTLRGGVDARGNGLGLGKGLQIRLRPLNLRHLLVPRLVQQPSGRLQGVNKAEEILAVGGMEPVRRRLGAQDIAPCLGPRAGAGPAPTSHRIARRRHSIITRCAAATRAARMDATGSGARTASRDASAWLVAATRAASVRSGSSAVTLA